MIGFGVSRAAVVACTTIALGPFATPRTSAAAPETNYLETIKVSDDVYVFKPRIDWIHGNGVAIIGPDGVVFIDTYIQFNYAEEAIHRLRRITPLPVRFVVNTHSHFDHVMGNAVFKRVFPESRIIVQDSAAVTMKKFDEQRVETEAQNIKDEIAQLDSEVRTGTTSNGTPIVGSMRAFWDWQLREAKEYQAQFHPERYAPPDITFSDTMTIRWGAQTLRLIHLAEGGHSGGDVIVWIPETRILVSGDIVVGPTPYATNPNIPGMIASLHKLIAMNPAVVIPGHGEIQHDLAYMRLLDTAFTTYRRAAEQAFADKVPAKVAGDSIAFPEIDRHFTNDDATKTWAYRAFFARNLIYGTYHSLSAAPGGGPR